MAAFAASFDIIDNRACPYYKKDDTLILTDQAVIMPRGLPACLILVRELTEILFTLLPDASSTLVKKRDTVYTCGGCTGLIKFQLGTTDQNVVLPGETDDAEAVMRGRFGAITLAELLQMFHTYQKTGKLLLDMEGGDGRVIFREGCIIAARFGGLDNQEAIYDMIGEKRGHFRFIPGLPSPLRKAREIGDFMMILMEGLKRLDKNGGGPPKE